MADVLFVAIVIAFFAVAAAYVRGCARIVGDDEVVRLADAASAGDAGGDPGMDSEVAA